MGGKTYFIYEDIDGSETEYRLYFYELYEDKYLRKINSNSFSITRPVSTSIRDEYLFLSAYSFKDIYFQIEEESIYLSYYNEALQRQINAYQIINRNGKIEILPANVKNSISNSLS